ncbi:hypothetical protein SAMN05421770_103444 [Granulicella rosea]|uniref:Lipoprotein n=1 Tax=Granulicella rosea TaxID=474952 RepID=A0A239J5B1_9BACT|nr:hypothetical protein [Granulicella rosea]SNT00979.1 hypothetical protein SAMN05421770_103444 [Granulicella rosea]
MKRLISTVQGRRTLAAHALLLSVCVLAGCRHKPNPVVLAAQTQAPEPLVAPPEPAKAPVVEQQPLPKAPVVTVKPPRKPRRKPAPVAPKPVETPVPAPVQVASAGAPAPDGASVIGALTTGGDASPQKHQQAADLIAACNKRLVELPAGLVEQQRLQVGQVKNFLRQSQAALDSGDSEGSLNLATKAKLLLDDLTK